jgi:hypothetical protein
MAISYKYSDESEYIAAWLKFQFRAQLPDTQMGAILGHLPIRQYDAAKCIPVAQQPVNNSQL